MIVNMALYGLNSSGLALGGNQVAVIHKIINRPSRADTNVWLRPSITANSFEYYKLVLCYVDNVLVIFESPYYTIQVLQMTFRMKVNRSEEQKIYLGSGIQVVEYTYSNKCWSMFPEKYVKMAIKTVEAKLNNTNEKLPTK